jgi:hypothetical protein
VKERYPRRPTAYLHRHWAAWQELAAHDLCKKTVDAVTLPTSPIAVKFAVGGGAEDKLRDSVKEFASLACSLGDVASFAKWRRCVW